MQTEIEPRNLIGRKAFDIQGTKVGTVDEVYLDDATGTPQWAAVRTGLFSRDAFVPLAPSEVVEDALRVPFERALIKDAPDFGAGRHLSPEQELLLYRHYGLDVRAPAEAPFPQVPLTPQEPGQRPPDREFGRIAGRNQT
ncbi:PRC-barrel domain-containing protein [Streptomyces sp. HNM0574]|uniref:PRC-barrel domain-containing protein n=1 Tax=Streptomyces sp. HNM0574 TaxID=2714954 RepID=UPI00146C4D34